MMRTLVTSIMAVFLAAVLVACGEAGSDGQPTDEPGEQSPNPAELDNEAGDVPPADLDGDLATGAERLDDPAAGTDPDEPGAGSGFDHDAATERARALLGTPEEELDDDPELRVVRRGDEEFPGTMDLRPGRSNLELDEVDGAMVVTRVVVEVPDGEGPIDVRLED